MATLRKTGDGDVSWALKVAPFVGTPILTLGLAQSALALSGAGTKMRLLGTGLLMAGGGLMLIAKRTGGTWRLALYLGISAIAAAALVVPRLEAWVLF